MIAHSSHPFHEKTLCWTKSWKNALLSARREIFIDFPKTILALIDPSKFFPAQFYREIIDVI